MKAHKFVIGGSSSDTVTVFCEHCGIVAPNCVLMRQMTMAEIDRERAKINLGCPLAPDVVKENGNDDETKNIDVGDAANLIMTYGCIEGEHHKTWLIGRVLRILLGKDEYNKFVASCNGNWDEGIAP